MFEYLIGSAAVCFIGEIVSKIATKYRLDELGYLILKKERNLEEEKNSFLSYLIYFVPGINNLVGLFYIVYSGTMIFGNEDFIGTVFARNPYTKRAPELYERYKNREQRNNLEEIKDALVLDGANNEILETELELASKTLNMPNSKEIKKITAMRDAELFLDEIEQDLDLTWEEYEELYQAYTKDFMAEESSGPALKRTFNICNRK